MDHGGLFVPTVVGSMPKPKWLYRNAREGDAEYEKVKLTNGKTVGNIWSALPKVWCATGAELTAAQNDATRLTVLDQERAGIEILSDGELRRVNYRDHLLERMGGFDLETKAQKTVYPAIGKTMMVPRCVGPIVHPGEQGCILDDLKFVKSITSRRVKVTLPAPMTVTSVSANQFYATEKEQGMAWAAAINKEAHMLADAGADVVQFDEPAASRFPDKLKEWGIEALDRCCEGLEDKCQTAVHVCYGYPVPGVKRTVNDTYPEIIGLLERSKVQVLALEFAGPKLDVAHLKHCPSKIVMFGAVYNGGSEVETKEEVCEKLLEAAKYLPPKQIMVAPDCGLVTLPSDLAIAKLNVMVEGCNMARRKWLSTHTHG